MYLINNVCWITLQPIKYTFFSNTVFTSKRRTSKFPTFLMNSSFPIVTNTHDVNRNTRYFFRLPPNSIILYYYKYSSIFMFVWSLYAKCSNKNSNNLIQSSLSSVSTQYKTPSLGNNIYATLKSLDWTYIQVILQPTPYFRNILSEFQRSRDSPYICAIRIFEINSTSNVENMMTVLQYETNTRGILVLTDDNVLE